MRPFQPLKFRTLKMGCFKMPHLQIADFQMGVTVASGHSDLTSKKYIQLIYCLSIEPMINLIMGSQKKPDIKSSAINGHPALWYFQVVLSRIGIRLLYRLAMPTLAHTHLSMILVGREKVDKKVIKMITPCN